MDLVKKIHHKKMYLVSGRAAAFRGDGKLVPSTAAHRAGPDSSS
jgi:hypothetical protein